MSPRMWTPWLVTDPDRHDPTWLHATRWGRWCECSCGWTSSNGTTMHAQLEFGRHLIEATS